MIYYLLISFNIQAWLPELHKQSYAPHVGRTVFQKICYIITEQGVDTGFKFKQGSYGPYSVEVKEALMVFANANYAMEKEFGKMTRLVIGSEYTKIRESHADLIQKMTNKINKTVDLFSRIKNTEQAEEVATIIYSVQQLKKDKVSISENEILDYILNWKNKWNTTEKKQSVALAIRNLVMLHWLRVEFSDDLILEEAFF